MKSNSNALQVVITGPGRLLGEIVVFQGVVERSFKGAFSN